MENKVPPKVKDDSQEKEERSEVVRSHIVRANRRDPNAKHIESAARQIQSKINNFNSPMNGRSAKVMPKSKVSESTKETQMDKVDEAILGGSASQRAAAKFGQNSAGRIAAMVRKEKERKAAQDDAHFEKQSKKMQDAINLHLRKGKTYSDAVKAAKVHVKEEVEQVDEKMNDLQKKAVKSALDYRSKIGMKSSTSDAKKIIKFVKNEEVEQVDEAGNLGKAMKKYKFWYGGRHADSGDPRHLKKNLQAAGPEFTKKIASNPDPKLSGEAELQRRIAKKMTKEEVEQIEEGRGRPAKVGSAAWHRQQAAAKSGESSDQEADKNIVNQMRKKPVGDTHHLVFGNGDKKEVHVKHVNKALSMLANTPKPADREKLQASLGHSHKRFMDTVTSGKPVEDAPRPKVSLGKMKAEAVDPTTSPAGTGHIIIQKRRMADGSYRIVKAGKSHSHRDIVDAQEAVTMYDASKSEEAEEKREGQKAPKGASDDMTKDSVDRMISLSPQAFKQKFKLPLTVGNLAAGGEDSSYAGGKYSVAEEKTLNNLYDNLSEENKEIFNNLMQTEDGIEKLLQFASKQGY